MIEQFFPNGLEHYVIGGILVGMGISLIYILTGLVAGASTFFTSTLSFVSKKPFFQRKKFLEERGWRFTFALGTILGGVIYLFTVAQGNLFLTDVQWYRLLMGGFLIGIGTRMGNGCPSGHGICGLSSFNLPSLGSVMIFLVIAIITAYIVSSLGVIP